MFFGTQCINSMMLYFLIHDIYKCFYDEQMIVELFACYKFFPVVIICCRILEWTSVVLQ